MSFFVLDFTTIITIAIKINNAAGRPIPKPIASLFTSLSFTEIMFFDVNVWNLPLFSLDFSLKGFALIFLMVSDVNFVSSLEVVSIVNFTMIDPQLNPLIDNEFSLMFSLSTMSLMNSFLK